MKIYKNKYGNIVYKSSNNGQINTDGNTTSSNKI